MNSVKYVFLLSKVILKFQIYFNAARQGQAKSENVGSRSERITLEPGVSEILHLCVFSIN